MSLFNRNLLWRTAAVTLLLLATSTMLYAKKPSNPGGGGDAATCTILSDTNSITQGQPVIFSATTSGLKGSKTYEWTFENGTPSTPTDSSVSVTYSDAGTFTDDVSLTVFGRRGSSVECSATVVVIAAVENRPPVANPDTFSTNEDTPKIGNVLHDNGGGADMDPDADGISVTTHDATSDQGASVSITPNGNFTYDPTGSSALQALNDGDSITDSFSYTISDDAASPLTNSTTVSITVSGITDGGGDSGVSINSTSQNGAPLSTAVPEHPLTGNSSYRVFGTNDLGMHCGDFDTRISSILPPFNILHAQVILRGGEPDILTPDDGVRVDYSAASNPDDPILTGVNSAGSALGSTDQALYPVISSIAGNGEVFKTNFWDAVFLGAYDPFYPPVVTPLAPAVTLDKGLPMPNVERLWLGDGSLTAVQQFMPGIIAPYGANNPQPFNLFTIDQPFFTMFPFGYVSPEVNWFEAAGIPLTAFDDFGRENPWPLYRVQAKNSVTGAVLASTDVVVPISGEANCGACHNAKSDGGNGSATEALGENVAIAFDDPNYGAGTADSVPLEVSLEYAADLNLVRLHDQKHGTNLEGNTPVVCQSCHYTPALDLAQVGPKGPGDADANSRQQTNVRSMSNVMHSHHGGIMVVDNTDESISVVENGGRKLFPEMAAAVDSSGILRDATQARGVLMETCYQCHPGRRTDCLRGAMANGGMLCQDCHGDMQQVGDDFTRTVGEVGGGFELASDFYTNPATPRVPWANEPGCGSCHTGDALDNMHADSETLGSPHDDIRLMQAFLADDSKATPIVPSNKRFAENVVTEGTAAGNPMLYRVSKGHEGVFCEACHGATHGIWPNKNPNANDNVTAMQLQGHTGTITECNTCHTGSFNIDDFKSSVVSGDREMGGPHGMHPVNDPTWNEKHKEVFDLNKNSCRTCHGTDGRGTVLSTTATTRTLECKNGDGNWAGCDNDNKYVTVEAGTMIGCNNCHSMEN